MEDNLGSEEAVTEIIARVYYGGVDHAIRQVIRTYSHLLKKIMTVRFDKVQFFSTWTTWKENQIRA